jgi:uncharacterized membrane protein YhaH (DUF805 family)
MIDVYKEYWKNYSNFDGRTSRRDYWIIFLWNTVLSFCLGFMDLVINSSGNTSEPSFGLLFGIFIMINLIPSFSILVRRLHDINKSGLYYFVVFILPVGPFILLYYLTRDTNNNNNNYPYEK